MTALTTPLNVVVGQFYDVPCARIVNTDCRSLHGNWWPVIGPAHLDHDIIDFDPVHIHIDVRFVKPEPYPDNILRPQILQPLVLHPHSPDPLTFEFSIRRRKCHRRAQLFPSYVSWLPALEVAHAGCRIGPDGLCPHRQIPIAAGHRLPDGSMVCPGHGLRWSTDGTLIPRSDP